MSSKIRTYIVAGVLLATQLAFSTGAKTSYADRYQMMGFCFINEMWMISIHNNEGGGRFWLKPGQGIGNLSFERFDATTQTAKLSYAGESFSLSLHVSNEFPIPVIRATAPSQKDMAQIEQKVADYESGLQQILLDPDSGPRTPETQAKINREVSTMVANYREKLISEQNALPEMNNAQDSASKARIGPPIRERNRVNSRIWAADHVSKHGAPEGAEYLIRENL